MYLDITSHQYPLTTSYQYPPPLLWEKVMAPLPLEGSTSSIWLLLVGVFVLNYVDGGVEVATSPFSLLKCSSPHNNCGSFSPAPCACYCCYSFNHWSASSLIGVLYSYSILHWDIMLMVSKEMTFTSSILSSYLTHN